MKTPLRRSIVSSLRLKGIVRSRDLVDAGMSRMELSRRVADGTLVRVSRGLYALPGYPSTEHASLAAIAKRSPGIVFCLLTALRFHELTTQSPFEVWIAIGNKAHPPRITYPPLRSVRFSPESMETGVDVHTVDGVKIRVTSPAKTVADCFKFRNKIGLDVALEALRDVLRQKKATHDDLWSYATINRVAKIIRPYLESVG